MHSLFLVHSVNPGSRNGQAWHPLGGCCHAFSFIKQQKFSQLIFQCWSEKQKTQIGKIASQNAE
jgi:hypothetical protein